MKKSLAIGWSDINKTRGGSVCNEMKGLAAESQQMQCLLYIKLDQT